jgi:Ca2+-binding RTX toxin-like protein
MRFPTRTVVTAGLLAAGLAATADAAQAAPAPNVAKGMLVVRGTVGNDTLALRLQAGKPNKLEIDFGDNGSAEFRVNRNKVDRIRVDTLRGSDRVRIDDGNGAFTDTISTVLGGGRGKDTLLGGRGDEKLKGGAGDDVVDGNQGDDTGVLGVGDDTFDWDPGDGSDTIEGQAGSDRMVFNGSGVSERFAVAANGGRVRFVRDVGSITMDLDDVERIDADALGGADTLTADDVSGTDLADVNVDLGATDDGAADTIVANGTNGDDAITASGSAGSASVLGLAARLDVTHANPAQDSLTINALAGDDVVEASGLAANAIKLVAHGNDGDDVLIGGAGADTLGGEAGDDVLLGGPGQDVLDGGPGDNIVIQD